MVGSTSQVTVVTPWRGVLEDLTTLLKPRVIFRNIVWPPVRVPQLST
jgi:hypothetical protein